MDAELAVTMTSNDYYQDDNLVTQSLYPADEDQSAVDTFRNLPGNLSVACLAQLTTNNSVAAAVHSSTFVTYKLVVDVYLVSSLCLAGLIGNALSIAVLRRDREKQNSTNWLLQTLAVVDTACTLAPRTPERERPVTFSDRLPMLSTLPI